MPCDHAAPTEAHRVRLIALLRAGLLAALVLVVLPLPTFAADGDAPTDPPTEPPTVEPAAEPTPTPDPTPTPEPARPRPRPDAHGRPDDAAGAHADALARPGHLLRPQLPLHGRDPAVHELLVRACGHPDDVEPHQRDVERHLRPSEVAVRGASSRTTGIATRPRATTSPAGPGRFATTPASRTSARSFVLGHAAMDAIVATIDRTGHPVGITVEPRHARLGRARLQVAAAGLRPDQAGRSSASTSAGRWARARRTRGSTGTSRSPPSERSTASTTSRTRQVDLGRPVRLRQRLRGG